MEFIKPIFAVIVCVIMLSLFQGALYFGVSLMFQYLHFWFAILLLAIIGFWTIYKMLRIVIIEVPFKSFRLTTGLASYVIGAWCILSSISILFPKFPIGYLQIDFKIFMLLKLVETASAISMLFIVQKFVVVAKELASLKKGNVES